MVKNLGEKRIVAKDLKVKYIMPLVQIDGILYVTD
jgi:hypothetical protein